VLALALLALAAGAGAPSTDGTYAGRTSEGGKLTVVVEGGRVARVKATVRVYVCDPEGDLGPIRVTVRPDAPLTPRRTFAFTAGPPSERLTVGGRLAGVRGMHGTLRLRGTIGTGDPCSSPPIAFTARRPAAGSRLAIAR
jgi:hypothetical protein